MAASGLFPPVLDTYMPAFLDKAGDFKINFDISDFNSVGDISTTVQVSVRDQYSNENLLKSPIEIVFKDYEIDTNTNQKYVKINKIDDLIDESFVIGKIYKIQLRFISSTAQHINQSITFRSFRIIFIKSQTSINSAKILLKYIFIALFIIT